MAAFGCELFLLYAVSHTRSQTLAHRVARFTPIGIISLPNFFCEQLDQECMNILSLPFRTQAGRRPVVSGCSLAAQVEETRWPAKFLSFRGPFSIFLGDFARDASPPSGERRMVHFVLRAL
jgi:hypothetical protein